MTTITPVPPRDSPVLISGAVLGIENKEFERMLTNSVFVQSWSGWFRNIFNILRPGITKTVPLPAATQGGTAGQLVFTNGILTGYTAST